jgi:3',5'-cyclic AMP phosphodiesterase CpdA
VASGVLTVLHTSDFQCGTPFVPRAADAMVRLSQEIQPDVVVSSGDLTQRAKVAEFEQARAVLARFGDLPVVLTPGNHDVPLYRFWERIVCPFRNWRRFAGPEQNAITSVQGATFVALCSAAPRRAIVNGRIDPEQLDFARHAFEKAPEDDVRIVVTHHHFVAVAGGEGGRPLPGAGQIAKAFEEMGVDAVLGGHVHQLHLRTTGDVGQGTRGSVPLVACGTTTSRRGRGAEVGWNSLMVMRFEERSVQVIPYLLGPEDSSFRRLEPVIFSPASGFGPDNDPASGKVS